MTLRLELFVNDLSASIDFYHRVLGFEVGPTQHDGYTPMRKAGFQLSLNLRANLPDDHPIQAAAGERLGRGVELVLEVGDIEGFYEHILASNWPISGDLEHRPWGSMDFRLLDPDGYYWRVTSR